MEVGNSPLRYQLRRRLTHTNNPSSNTNTTFTHTNDDNSTYNTATGWAALAVAIIVVAFFVYVMAVKYCRWYMIKLKVIPAPASPVVQGRAVINGRGIFMNTPSVTSIREYGNNNNNNNNNNNTPTTISARELYIQS